MNSQRAVSSTALFFVAKKREWTMRETIRRSARHVVQAIKTPLTPRFPKVPEQLRRTQTKEDKKEARSHRLNDMEKGFKTSDSTKCSVQITAGERAKGNEKKTKGWGSRFAFDRFLSATIPLKEIRTPLRGDYRGQSYGRGTYSSYNRRPYQRAYFNEEQDDQPYDYDENPGEYYEPDTDVQVAYAIFSTWTLFIDDIGGEIEDALKAFERNLIHGKPQSTPILQSYVEYLQGFEKLFGPYSGAVVSTTATSWIYGSVIELKYEGKIKPPAGAFNFPRFVRDKCGIAEPNFHMVFPEELFPEESHLEIFLPIIPDLNDCINYINDVLSFYKETVVGPERFTYICNLAEVQSISIQDALRLTCAGIIQNMRNIRKVLSRCPQILDAADQFLCGYISWHLFQDRYRLSEIELVDANGNRIRRPGQEHEA
ncbi:hypothetical protein CNMCM5793_000199 [Aspergillus hiratsukae]|uniref:Trichodiene synthase n=1 Tax=Aspergillus hiratsukae TaxID=1194566 RepID=A0A8H6P9M7_9EURO|nr:hypothetical protein CNMCM5793_000199 [Aspergillus hiratsukae]KAF7164041.1 hypothetical protein CNMCM6106_000735 [Aspergillus hiratsukae]